MSPSSYFPIGRKARDLLYKDYIRRQALHFHYQSFDWSFDVSCQVEEILPGLKSIFRVVVPDSGKAELEYLNDYVGIGAGVGIKANSSGELYPIVNFSGVIGSSLVSLGADLGFDIATGTLNKFNAGLSFNSAVLIASLTLDNRLDKLRVSCYRLLNPPTSTAIAAELKHSFSENKTTVSLGAQHALFPSTLVKAQVHSSGSVGAVIRQALWQKFLVGIAGEVDFSDRNSIPRIGFSMALRP
ncbi:hypothetical protein SLA2020_019200 [Shorea laevis]